MAAWLVAAAVGTARAQTAEPKRRVLDIYEYRVEGARQLSAAEVEETVLPFMGPQRPLDDIEKARAALEKLYSDKGYQSVSVAIPPQRVVGGVVLLHVSESTVGRLRVRGSRWFSLGEIRAQAPSMAEGAVPNFNDIVRDIYALNQIPDRRVTPVLRAGVEPGTIDVELNVKDRLPLHGSLEVNDRFSANTTVPRLNGSLHYDNLWQMGHSLTFSFQVAPKRPQDAEVFSAAYLMRFAGAPWLTVTLNGVLQNSDVSTLGAVAVQGRGRIFGGRATFALPGASGFFHNLTVGLDYKHFGKELQGDPFAAPITYWPGTAQYGATWASETATTQLGATVVFNLRGLSSAADAFDAKRYQAGGAFIDYRGDLARTDELPGGFQLVEKIQGQYSADPLIPSEQLIAGGVDSVRGYLEAQAAGDLGFFGTVEARSPSLGPAGSWLDEWRLHLFGDGARLANRNPLPEQQWLFFLWSAGGGTRFRAFEAFNGSFDLAVPLRTQGSSKQFHPRLQFRIWAEF